jgi:hypothetical protein
MYAGVAMDVLLAKSEGAREAVSPGGCLTVIKERARNAFGHINQWVEAILQTRRGFSATIT